MASGYRREFLEKLASGEELGERELLNIILSNAYAGKDFSAVTDALLSRFPSVRALIDAGYAELMSVDGVTETVASYLKSLKRADEFMNHGELYIDSIEKCFAVAAERFRGKVNESAEVYLLNKSGKVTRIKYYTSGRPDKVEMTSGEILSAISSSDAYGLYFAHNHLNCAATPSADDDDVTRKLIEACDMCKIVFYDHCIVSSNGDRFSYSKSGRLESLRREVEYFKRK